MSTAPASGPPRTGWFPLPVARLEHLGDDAVAITLEVPPDLAATFAHRAGQHVVVRHRGGTGGELRRSYSVSPPPGDPTALRLVVKPVGPDGFGAFARTALAEGELLELSPPAGRFGLPGTAGGHHVLIAGGCGITPLAPMAATALRADPGCRVSLVHGVRTAQDALLSDELAVLKDEFVDRFDVLHVLSRERSESALCTGRIDAPKLRRLLSVLDARPERAHFALCGPFGLVEVVRDALVEWGAAPEDVRTELFTTAGAPPAPEPAAPVVHRGRVTAVLGGRTSVVTMRPQDAVVLDAVLRRRPEAPYSCREGVCGSCRAKVVSGAVTTGPQHALDAHDLDGGYTLACRARPSTDDLTLDFDA